MSISQQKKTRMFERKCCWATCTLLWLVASLWAAVVLWDCSQDPVCKDVQYPLLTFYVDDSSCHVRYCCRNEEDDFYRQPAAWTTCPYYRTSLMVTVLAVCLFVFNCCCLCVSWTRENSPSHPSKETVGYQTIEMYK